MQVELVMFKSDGTRREFPIKPEGFVIGRKNNCDLRIPLSSVSRKHCEVRLNGDQVVVKDLGSSNGTYHNNIRVTEAVLAAGDELVVGPVVFTVVVDGQPDDIKPVKSLVETPEELHDSSIVLPTNMLELNDEPTDGGGDTMQNITELDADDELAPIELPDLDGDDDEDPIAALDRLAELELPESDGKA